VKFPVHNLNSAPETTRPILEGVQKKFGFIPNLHAVFATSPTALEAYGAIAKALENSALDPVEQQVVFLTVSASNGCDYCVAAHSMLATMASMPPVVLNALREGGAIPDPRLNALAKFTKIVREHQGWVPDSALKDFAQAGYGERHVLDVITILAMKTLSNYTNHIARTPLDTAFAAHAWDGGRSAA